MYQHQDVLSDLNRNAPLNAKLKTIHDVVRKKYEFIDRIAVALYDEKSFVLKTFLASSGRDYPIEFYEAHMEDAPSLADVVKRGKPRLLNDLSVLASGRHEHTRKIMEQGYRASYTMPMYFNMKFAGFVFFNSYTANVFVEDVLRELDVFAHLVTQLVMQEITTIRAVFGALRSAAEMVSERDPQTGIHIDRMAQFVRVIARDLAESGKYDLNDEKVERIFWFAPLHDVGKIGLSDAVLMKAGNFTSPEFEQMKSHPVRGLRLINSMIENFGFETFAGIDILRNIATYHHEKMDGTGYPEGLKGQEIPIEARIVAVADIFDAITSRRRYKQAWSNDEAFSLLERLSLHEIDRDCVAALKRNQDRIQEIQAAFAE